MIYTHVFGNWNRPKSLDPLRTCRQIYDEASILAYRITLFRVHTEHWPDSNFFQTKYVSRLPPKLIPAVQHLTFRLPRGMPYEPLCLQPFARRLRTSRLSPEVPSNLLSPCTASSTHFSIRRCSGIRFLLLAQENPLLDAVTQPYLHPQL
jgi:hypothetical protein